MALKSKEKGYWLACAPWLIRLSFWVKFLFPEWERKEGERSRRERGMFSGGEQGRNVPNEVPMSVLFKTLTLKSLLTLHTISTALPTVRWESCALSSAQLLPRPTLRPSSISPPLHRSLFIHVRIPMPKPNQAVPLDAQPEDASMGSRM